MEQSYLSTEALSVGYRGEALIRDISISVRRGEILTLIGPNGAGKSTILKSLIRQLKLVSGVVVLDGKNLEELSERELSTRLSVLMTERIRPELMTCEDVVATGRYPYTGRLGILSEHDRDVVRSAMERVHAWELRDRDFGEISDGQRQRVLLARAVCQEPEIIVLDEPTSFLDIRHKLELLTLLKEMVQTENLAVILSLHELDLAQRISDRVVCVKGDRIALFGTPEEVFRDSYIHELYGMTNGSYQSAYGTVELERVCGEPQVFVIGGGGSGIPVYRELQRRGIPFAAGILPENDLDYPAAKALAARLISVPAFHPLEEALEEAKDVLQSCKEVRCCVQSFGAQNEANRILQTLATEKSK
ncbi:MAG: ATP-binding cassette domain-containing protein [Oscillospiraceae bacterium]|nr:ATP-binding cassette domain-containing protein [Oscillospiraceae bacterium]